MILKGNQRGGSVDLALHLIKDENDHIEVHELRGFISQDLMGALNEAYAVSRGTQCKRFLYSLSLNPPEDADVPVEQFEATINRIEEKLGLTGQPRAIVFHEKEGRRHAHAVWSRIDTKVMKAVHMPFDHERLMDISRDLYLEHGWRMPEGLADRSKRDPRNYTLADYQQAKRAGKDARDIKGGIQDAWAISDNKAAFSHALDERGFMLARGDKRASLVVVDTQGQVYGLARTLKVKEKAVRTRVGEPDALPSIADATKELAKQMAATMDRLNQELRQRNERLKADTLKRKAALVTEQRAKRVALTKAIELRSMEEARTRQERFRSGLGGIWDRLRGEHKRIRALNEQDAKAAASRDAQEKHSLIQAQLHQRRALKQRALSLQKDLRTQKQAIDQDKARYVAMKDTARDDAREAFKEKRRQPRQSERPRRRSRGYNGPSRGPGL